MQDILTSTPKSVNRSSPLPEPLRNVDPEQHDDTCTVRQTCINAPIPISITFKHSTGRPGWSTFYYSNKGDSIIFVCLWLKYSQFTNHVYIGHSNLSNSSG